MRYLLTYILSALALAVILPACNDSKSSDDEATIAITYSNVAVTSFSLAEDDSVLAGLDSVYFSIDLNNALIYNADSLPKGTDISALVLDIGLPTVSSAILIESPDASGNRKEVDYAETTTDSINFTYGDVTLRITSYDEAVTRDYTIKVNVHTMEPDSLYWNSTAMRTLPGSISNPTAQKSLTFNDKCYCLVSNGSSATLSVTENPYNDDWTVKTANLPAEADVNTFSASSDALYIVVGDARTLYTSADGIDWTATSVSGIRWIYGGYGSSILASQSSADGYVVLRYPEMTTTAVDNDFPVDMTSQLLTFTTIWSGTNTCIVVGGRTASGTITAETWAYDGSSWAAISKNGGFPTACEGMTVFPYFCFKTDTDTWVTTEYSVLVAFGGRDADGTMQESTYISYDQGMHWGLAGSLMQLPSYIPSTYSAQALVFKQTMYARSGSSTWREMPAVKLQPWFKIDRGVNSRAVAPITEWECPFVYLFGGYPDSGALCNTVWRGVINRLMFKPLQ